MTHAPPAIVNRPNLLLVGAQKSGSTSLATALSAHQNIFLPPEKELNFFSRPDWADGLDAYFKRFKSNSKTQYWMDATPGYMWTQTKYGRRLGDTSPMKHDIASAVRDTLGADTRIISIMRHPVRRAVSAFFHQFRMGRLSTQDRIRDIGHRFGLVDLGFYSEHLAVYRAHFPAKAIKTYFFESYTTNTELVHRDLFFWLGLDPFETKTIEITTNERIELDYSEGTISVKNGLDQIRELAEKPEYKKMKFIEPPIVEQADLDFLNDIYADDLEEMARMHPATLEIWPRRLTMENYNERLSTSGRVKHQLLDSKRTAAMLNDQIGRISRLHVNTRKLLNQRTGDVETLGARIATLEGEQHERLLELSEMAELLSDQEKRQTASFKRMERALTESRADLAKLKGQAAVTDNKTGS